MDKPVSHVDIKKSSACKTEISVQESTWREIVSSLAEKFTYSFLDIKNHHDHHSVKQNLPVQESTWREIVSSQGEGGPGGTSQLGADTRGR